MAFGTKMFPMPPLDPALRLRRDDEGAVKFVLSGFRSHQLEKMIFRIAGRHLPSAGLIVLISLPVTRAAATPDKVQTTKEGAIIGMSIAGQPGNANGRPEMGTTIMGHPDWILIGERHDAPPGSPCERQDPDGQGWFVKAGDSAVSVTREKLDAVQPSAQLPPALLQALIAGVKGQYRGIEDFELALRSSGQQPPAVKVEDGWISGFNFGEFGGGVYWISKDGRKIKQLIHENLVFIYTIDDEIWVFTGLLHLGLDFGHVLKLSRRGKSGKVLANIGLAGYPLLATRWIHEESLVVVTANGVRRIWDDDELEIVSFEPALYELHPTSIAVQPTRPNDPNLRRDIYIGTADYVIRIPFWESGLVQWWSPKKCTPSAIESPANNPRPNP
jgi:hypothetical protein